MPNMSASPENQFGFEEEPKDHDVAEQLTPGVVAAVVSGTDWTTETLACILKKIQFKF